MATWQWDARDYAANSSGQLRWARELLGKLRLSDSERVLDLGCGDGKVTAEIASLLPNGEAVGLDSSRDMVLFARRRFEGVRNLSFVLGDASALVFDGEFDVVFSNAALHWVLDHGPVLRGISRALRPGGRALLQMGGRGNAAAFLEILEEMMAEERWRPHFKGFPFPYGFWSPAEYSAWLQGTDLEPQRLELLARDLVAEGLEGLKGWIRTGWLPYTSRLPAGRDSEFVEEAARRYVARRPADADGLVRVPMVRLEAELLKRGPC